MSACEPDVGWSRWPAPAKLNLFLRIVGRRADGYHLLQTLFQLLDWGDEVALRIRTDGAIVRVHGNAAIAAENDLTVRAARLLQAHTGCRLGCEIGIDKRIPMGGGFGGGSSDAATVLVALNHLWQTRLDADRLAELGLRLGADVPVFVRGDNAWAEGIGERLTPVTLPARAYLIVDPGVHVPTAALFAAPELTRDGAPTTIRAVLSGQVSGNAFAPVLRAREPAVAAVLDVLSRFGTACVTGSGGGCFIGFASAEAAHAAHAALQGRWRAWIAMGVVRSPLRDRVVHLS